MRVHVALGPADFPAARRGARTALVVDVMRASTTVVAACAAGCLRVVPVSDREAALRAAAGLARTGPVLLAGERGGESLSGFDLGNSPLEYTAGGVAGRTVVLTTTNGTAAMLEAAGAEAAAVAAFTNLEASARWAVAAGRDVTILCAGEAGELSLEDAVCAGFLVESLADGGARLEPTDAATAARRIAHFYAACLHRLAEDSRWARRLIARGRQADVDACLTRAGLDQVPVLRDGAFVPGPAAARATAGPVGAVEKAT